MASAVVTPCIAGVGTTYEPVRKTSRLHRRDCTGTTRAAHDARYPFSVGEKLSGRSAGFAQAAVTRTCARTHRGKGMTEHRNAAATIIATELSEDLKPITDLEEALKLAFRKVQNHWMFTDK